MPTFSCLFKSSSLRDFCKISKAFFDWLLVLAASSFPRLFLHCLVLPVCSLCPALIFILSAIRTATRTKTERKARSLDSEVCNKFHERTLTRRTKKRDRLSQQLVFALLKQNKLSCNCHTHRRGQELGSDIRRSVHGARCSSAGILVPGTSRLLCYKLLLSFCIFIYIHGISISGTFYRPSLTLRKM